MNVKDTRAPAGGDGQVSAQMKDDVITVAGQKYEKTGSTSCGKKVFCKLGDFERACKSFTDELLFVEIHPGELVPLETFK